MQSLAISCIMRPMDRDTMQGKLLGYEQLIEEIMNRGNKVYHMYGLLISKKVIEYDSDVLFDRTLLAKKMSKCAFPETAHMYRDSDLEW